jgi:hypothetical protein
MQDYLIFLMPVFFNLAEWHYQENISAYSNNSQK